VIQRRAFLTGLIGIIAAPAIVRASSLMPVKALPAEFFYNDTWVDVSRWTTLTIEDIDRTVRRLKAIGVPAYRGEYLGICFRSDLGLQ